ncbi:mitochondrial membrane protein Pet127 [Colletotrichum acutatum]
MRQSPISPNSTIWLLPGHTYGKNALPTADILCLVRTCGQFRFLMFSSPSWHTQQDIMALLLAASAAFPEALSKLYSDFSSFTVGPSNSCPWTLPLPPANGTLTVLRIPGSAHRLPPSIPYSRLNTIIGHRTGRRRVFPAVPQYARISQPPMGQPQAVPVLN